MRLIGLGACVAAIALAGAVPALAQTPAASSLQPNLIGHIDKPLRYTPDNGDFVIRNGVEFFNRSLYGGHTGFRVDGGDKPEFVLYLPGRGGNLRLAIRTASGAKWLHEAAEIETRYQELRQEVEGLCREAGFQMSLVMHTSDLGEAWGNVFVGVCRKSVGPRAGHPQDTAL